jgi:glycosyltransferase involved in cell wall biosynthesis
LFVLERALTSAPFHRPVVLCVVDRPGWAHDRKTDALANALAGTYDLIKRYQAEVAAEDFARADCVLFYYWMQVERLGPLREALERSGKPVIIGICSHRELEGEARARGLSMLNTIARAAFANSQFLVDEFGAQLTPPIHYTPNGVDTDFFRPAASLPTSESFRVGWAGAFANHTSEHRGVNEVIAPAVASVEGAELSLALREEKWRNKDEMLHFYQALDVYVCASLSEGTPNPCLEAAACGLPVITTRVGNMPEFIRDGVNGYFIERDIPELIARLRLLRNDPSLRSAVGSAARATAEQWDWRRHAANYDVMLRSVFAAV